MFSKKFAVLLSAAAFVIPMTAHAADHHAGDAAVAQAYIKEIQNNDKAYICGAQFSILSGARQGTKAARYRSHLFGLSRAHQYAWTRRQKATCSWFRNIGNQLATQGLCAIWGEPSGLLVVAVYRALFLRCDQGGGRRLFHAEEPIKKELDAINITKGSANIDGVKTNVNNQVAAAMEEFADKVKNGELLIVGAVYDFADDMKQGAGQSQHHQYERGNRSSHYPQPASSRSPGRTWT